MMAEYQLNIVNYDPFVWILDIQNKCKQFVKDFYKIPEKEKIVKKQEIKKPKVGKKKCPNCNSDLEYLTEWKKHLVCRSCGVKERNYIKK